MSCVYKPNGNPWCRGDRFFVGAWYKILYYTHGIFHRVGRYKFRFTLTASLTVTPFCLKHLNMRAVTEHDIAEVTGCLGRIDRTHKAFRIDSGQVSGMVHMRVCQKNEIQVSRINWDFLILIIIRSLFHTAVYQKLLTCCFQIITTTSYFVRRPNKGNLHVRTPFF